MARTSKVIENGMAIGITGGVQKQDGILDLYRCNACNGEVVWATSKKTGRMYLVNVSRAYNDWRYYNKRDVHKCAAKDSQ